MKLSSLSFLLRRNISSSSRSTPSFFSGRQRKRSFRRLFVSLIGVFFSSRQRSQRQGMFTELNKKKPFQESRKRARQPLEIIENGRKIPRRGPYVMHFPSSPRLLAFLRASEAEQFFLPRHEKSRGRIQPMTTMEGGGMWWRSEAKEKIFICESWSKGL